MSSGLTTMSRTGRAQMAASLHGPESMHRHCFQISARLLIIWQLLLAFAGYRLHLAPDGSCCASSQHVPGAAGPVASPGTSCLCHCPWSHGPQPLTHESGECPAAPTHREPMPPLEPHDCANCEVCHALAGPRTLVAVVVLPAPSEAVAAVPDQECADPMLGFALRPQCRAPPSATCRPFRSDARQSVARGPVGTRKASTFWRT